MPTDALAKQAALRETVQKQPNDVAGWIALSQACQALVDEQGAIDAARAAIDLAPDNVDAIRQYAYSLVQVGTYDGRGAGRGSIGSMRWHPTMR